MVVVRGLHGNQGGQVIRRLPVQFVVVVEDVVVVVVVVGVVGVDCSR